MTVQNYRFRICKYSHNEIIHTNSLYRITDFIISEYLLIMKSVTLYRQYRITDRISKYLLILSVILYCLFVCMISLCKYLLILSVIQYCLFVCMISLCEYLQILSVILYCLFVLT